MLHAITSLKKSVGIYAIAPESFYTGGGAIDSQPLLECLLECLIAEAIQHVIA
ncbi:MAG: hypothetical protein KME42_02690 [Tildeniella nuda ZEHNDER 1965/U140]|nr:hypothetical protein [Tildeniella nuda ZEHNDER 1965/U140]